MSQNFTELIQEVQGYMSRNTSDVHITTARVGRWVNQAQRKIVMDNPGLRDVHKVDKTTWTLATDQYEYDMSDFSTFPIAHLLSIKYIDTTGTNYKVIPPYQGGVIQWDEDYPYIPEFTTGIPEEYIRRGNTVEIYPAPSSSENTMPLWVEYSYLPALMTGTDATALTDFDEAIIQMSIALGYRMIPNKVADARDAFLLARTMINERVDSELDLDTDLVPIDYGP